MQTKLKIVLFVAVLGLSARAFFFSFTGFSFPVSAAIIYQDDFTGTPGSPLNGRAPNIANATGYGYTAATVLQLDGSGRAVSANGSGYASIALPAVTEDDVIVMEGVFRPWNSANQGNWLGFGLAGDPGGLTGTGTAWAYLRGGNRSNQGQVTVFSGSGTVGQLYNSTAAEPGFEGLNPSTLKIIYTVRTGNMKVELGTNTVYEGLIAYGGTTNTPAPLSAIDYFTMNWSTGDAATGANPAFFDSMTVSRTKRYSFSGAIPSDFTVESGTWATQAGVLSGTGGVIRLGETNWADFTLNVRLRAQQGVSGAVWDMPSLRFRQRDSENYYEIQALTDGDLVLRRIINGQSFMLYTYKYSGVFPNEWHELLLVQSGSSLSVRLNDQPIFALDDPAPVPFGTIALVAPGTTAWDCDFVDVEITKVAGAVNSNRLTTLDELLTAELNTLLPPAPGVSPNEVNFLQLDPLSAPNAVFPRLWRNWPRPGDSLDRKDSYINLMPQWLTNAPLVKVSPHAKGIFFADEVTAVRLLGGWAGAPFYKNRNQADVAGINANGEIFYRWEYIDRRLGGLVENGIRPVIVFDNVMFAFTSTPILENYGQTVGPDDYVQYAGVIREICRYLVNRFGMSEVSQWRFRIGTEPNWSRYVPEEEFAVYYDYVSAAIRDEIPLVKVGPGNLVIPYPYKWNPDGPYIRFVQFVDSFFEHCATGINHATGQTGSPVDFISASFYFTPRVSSDPARRFGLNPENVRYAGLLLRKIRDSHPCFAGVPLELQEFGISRNLLNNTSASSESTEPGIFGGALTLHTYASALESGIIKLNDWGSYRFLDQLRDSEHPKDYTKPDKVYTKPILAAQSWLNGVLDNAVGGDFYPLQYMSRPGSLNPDTALKGFAVVHPAGGKVYIAVSAWNYDRFLQEPISINIQFPFSKAPFINPTNYTVKQVYLDPQSSVYDVIHADLAAQGHLARDPDYIYPLGDMATSSGLDYLDVNYAKYQALQVAAFTPAPYTGTINDANGWMRIPFSMNTPSVLILIIE